MKKVDASRPGLSLPTRLGVLALATLGGVVAAASIMAKQNGTDVMSSLATLDFAKAYSKENLNYSLAEAKLKLGDRKGAAALIKTLPFTDGENDLSYKELRQRLVRAQIAAKEFTEALQNAQNEQSLQTEVLIQQKRVEGLDATLKNASALSEPSRSAALVLVAVQYAGQGDTTTTEAIIAQLPPLSRESVYQSLTSAYYKAGKLDDALGAVRRIANKDRKSSALSQLGSSCLQNKDGLGVRRVLEEMPAEASQHKTIKVGTTGTVTTQTIHSQRYQLLQNVAYNNRNDTLFAAETLELIQRYAHPDEFPELLRAVCSAARSKQDNKTTQAALALLRPLTSEEGKQAYDQEVQQLLYNRAKSDLLALVQTIHSDQMRSSALQNLAFQAKTIAEFKPILASLRKIPAPSNQNLHDSAILMFMNRAEQANPEQAKALAQQIIDPERRNQILASLTARHP